MLVDDHSKKKKKRKERKLTCRLATHFHTFHFYITTKQNVCVSPPFYDKDLKNNLLLMRPPTLSVFQPLPLKIMNTEPHSHSCARPSEEAPPLSSWANGARTPLIILIPGWPMGASNTGSHDAFLCAPCPQRSIPASAGITEDLTPAESDVRRPRRDAPGVVLCKLHCHPMTLSHPVDENDPSLCLRSTLGRLQNAESQGQDNNAQKL